MRILLRCPDFRDQHFGAFVDGNLLCVLGGYGQPLTSHTTHGVDGDCSVVYGLKDAVSHCFSLVCTLVEYFRCKVL